MRLSPKLCFAIVLRFLAFSASSRARRSVEISSCPARNPEASSSPLIAEQGSVSTIASIRPREISYATLVLSHAIEMTSLPPPLLQPRQIPPRLRNRAGFHATLRSRTHEPGLSIGGEISALPCADNDPSEPVRRLAAIRESRIAESC
jgi:hypothetical protein